MRKSRRRSRRVSDAATDRAPNSLNSLRSEVALLALRLSLVHVVDALDVIFSKVTAGLHLDQLKRGFARLGRWKAPTGV